MGLAEVYPAGSRPSGKVNPKAIESMREVGYVAARHRSKGLSEIPDNEYDLRSQWGRVPLLLSEMRNQHDSVPGGDPKQTDEANHRCHRKDAVQFRLTDCH